VRGLLPDRVADALARDDDPVFAWRTRWASIDWPILLVALVLLGIGVVFIQAMAEADALFLRDDVSLPSHLRKVVVSAPVLVVAFFLRPRWLRRHGGSLYAAALLLLLLVPLVGDVRNNARRWIQLPLGFDLQPSELAKLALILFLAKLLYQRRLDRRGEWWAPVLAAAVPMGMVALQPDLGTAMTIVPIALGMFYLAGARGRVLALAVVGVCLAGAVAWKAEVGHDYQLKRVHTWLATFDPEGLIDARKRGAYHAYQARVSIGNGGVLGTGLGKGVANQTGHLPERESDSIFAVIAEEGGFLGAGGVLVAYGLLVGFLLLSAAGIRERFSRLVVGGIGVYFGAHFFINVGVNLGLLPMTGLPLPLVSTGGSSMLASFAALGLALGLSARHEPSLDEDAFRV